MNSKQRVLKTIAHEEPDRVPVGEWGIDHDHVSAILGRHTFWRNRRGATLALWEGRRDEVVESMKRDYAELIETLDYDVIPVDLVPAKGYRPKDPPAQVEEGVWRDSAGRVFKYAASNDSIMCLTPPPRRDNLDGFDIEAYRRQLLCIDDTQFELVDFIADRFARTRALVFRGLDVYDPLMAPFGGDESHQLMMTATAPEEIKKLHDVAVAYNLALMEHCARKGVALAMQGQDFGGKTGCIMSPASIRELFMRPLKRIAGDAARLGMIPFFHCCGRIWDILDDWVAAGFLGYQSIQGSAGMDLARVKAEYGDKMTLWAGIQCETLIQGTLDEVTDEVQESLEVCMPGGGFIFGSTNSVQYGAKTENYVRALDVVKRFGRYE